MPLMPPSLVAGLLILLTLPFKISTHNKISDLLNAKIEGPKVTEHGD